LPELSPGQALSSAVGHHGLAGIIVGFVAKACITRAFVGRRGPRLTPFTRNGGYLFEHGGVNAPNSLTTGFTVAFNLGLEFFM
jgi:hypothetical protein